MATLTYSYAESTVVVGPISIYAEPHSYDLCAQHADSVTPPRTWEIMRLNYRSEPKDDGADDLLALAEAVREPRNHRTQSQEAAADQQLQARHAPAPLSPPDDEASIARGHLRLLRD